jgi:hypothetical protein
MGEVAESDCPEVLSETRMLVGQWTGIAVALLAVIAALIAFLIWYFRKRQVFLQSRPKKLPHFLIYRKPMHSLCECINPLTALDVWSDTGFGDLNIFAE